jgi:hypothetical protein
MTVLASFSLFFFSLFLPHRRRQPFFIGTLNDRMVKNNKVIAIDQNFNDAATWILESELSRSMSGTAVEVTKNSNLSGNNDFFHVVDLSAAFNRCPGCKYTCVSSILIFYI